MQDKNKVALKSPHIRLGCYRSAFIVRCIADIPVGGKSPCQLDIPSKKPRILIATFDFSMPSKINKVFK